VKQTRWRMYGWLTIWRQVFGAGSLPLKLAPPGLLQPLPHLVRSGLLHTHAHAQGAVMPLAYSGQKGGLGGVHG
jgi:hypothetical protein